MEMDSQDTETTIGDIEQSVQVFVSIYQLYNENINDLISKNGKMKNLNAR